MRRPPRSSCPLDAPPVPALPSAALVLAALLFAALLLVVPGVPAAAQIPGLTAEAPAEEEAPAPEPVDARTSPEADAEIERRLEEIYATVGGLEGVRVEVRSGVVTLGGEVLAEDSRQQAVDLARQIRGVVEVEESIEQVRDVRRRLGNATGQLRDTALDVVAALPLLAVALAVFALFWWLGRWVGAREGLFRRLAPSPFLRELLAGAVGAGIVIAGALLALELLDATALVAAIAGAVGLAGLAIGFAFRDTVENYIASVLLSLRQPFLPLDHVVVEGHEGKVVRLTSRATILMTLEGNHVRIPNAQVFRAVILNYTRNPRRRFDFTVGVAVDADLAEALALGTKTLRALDGVLEDPPVQAWIDELGDSNVVLHFFAWIDQRHTEWAKARGEAIRRVKVAFDEAGVEMPEPIYNLRLTERRVVAAPEGASPAGGIPQRERPAVGAFGPEAGEAPQAGRAWKEAPAAAVPDLAADRHLDREVAQDRAGEPDLLDPGKPVE